MTAPRRGDWMQTYTGRPFWPLDPREEDVEALDIAHALSMICRFGGHTSRFYNAAMDDISLRDLDDVRDVVRRVAKLNEDGDGKAYWYPDGRV